MDVFWFLPTSIRPGTGPFGEMIANDVLPTKATA